jgi:uncharacterized membrane protein
MCQQWLSVLGLVSDVVGFLMILYEWRVMFERHMGEKKIEIEAFFERRARHAMGEPEPPEEEVNWSMGKHMAMGLEEDVKFRGRMVMVGTGLVVIGFLLQVAGTWPGGIFGIKIC